MEYSPAKVKRRAAARKGQERRWAAKAGPVEIRKVGEAEPSPRDSANN